jgi:hypothetical protein
MLTLRVHFLVVLAVIKGSSTTFDFGVCGVRFGEVAAVSHHPDHPTLPALARRAPGVASGRLRGSSAAWSVMVSARRHQ